MINKEYLITIALTVIFFAPNALRAAAGRVLLDFMFAIRSHVQ
jgi:hypothetical protein